MGKRILSDRLFMHMTREMLSIVIGNAKGKLSMNYEVKYMKIVKIRL